MNTLMYKLSTQECTANRFHPLYVTWKQIRQGCNNPKSSSYSYLGAKDITYTRRWDVFQNFVDDMGTKPTNKHILCRLDTSGDFCKDNCKWVTRKEHFLKKSSTRLIEFAGDRHTLTDWAIKLGIKRSTLAQRLYTYKWSIEETLTKKRSTKKRSVRKHLSSKELTVRRREYNKRWRELNPDKWRVINKANVHKHRALGNINSSEWIAKVMILGNMCQACHKKEPDVKITIDHIIPVSKGGTNHIDNLQPLCLDCNKRKYNHSFEDFLKKTRGVLVNNN